jgi:hypothetical protein
MALIDRVLCSKFVGLHQWERRADGGPLGLTINGDPIEFKTCLRCGATLQLTVIFAGTLVTSSVAFAAIGGAATDPTTVTFSYQLGSGTPVVVWTYLGAGSITRTGTGGYAAAIDTTGAVNPTTSSVTIKWIGTGACQVTTAASFQVTAPPI